MDRILTQRCDRFQFYKNQIDRRKKWNPKKDISYTESLAENKDGMIDRLVFVSQLPFLGMSMRNISISRNSAYARKIAVAAKTA